MNFIITESNKGKEEVPAYIKQMVARHFTFLEGNADFIDLIAMEMRLGENGLTNLFQHQAESAQGWIINHNKTYTIYWAWLELGRPKGFILHGVNLNLPDKTHSWLFSIMTKALAIYHGLSKDEEQEIFIMIIQHFYALIEKERGAA